VIDVESFASQLTDCYQRMWLIAAAVTGDRAEADDIVQQASMIGLQNGPILLSEPISQLGCPKLCG
jgi:DNA-directed RNA polymerase specialized sigma24 family protein